MNEVSLGQLTAGQFAELVRTRFNVRAEPGVEVVRETNATTINLPRGVAGGLSAGGDRLKGLLDETVLFNRALTPAEIQQVLNATRGV